MLLTIGDFARATHLTVKTLRHYHRVGLLAPVEIDEETGYRHYAPEQIAVAQVIRRLRDLDMPLEQIREAIAADDPGARNAILTSHLDRLQESLRRTQGAVGMLRDLLDNASAPLAVEHVRLPETAVIAISDVVDGAELSPWFQGAIGELLATLAAQEAVAAGPPGAIFAAELFEQARGEATVFVPYTGGLRATGRVTRRRLPAVELAVAVHVGPHDDVDRTYGTLATHVAERELSVDGPIRERYLVGRHDGAEPAAWRTEVGWPIFITRDDG